MIELPKSRSAIERINPKRLIIYSKPKVGKTSLLAELENNLILDFERGSSFVSAMKMSIDSLDTLKEVGEAIKAAGKPYKYITIDTVTSMEDMCLGFANKLYKDTVMGKSFTGDSVLKLANGAGWQYLREAFFKILDYIETLVPEEGAIILSGHLKDKLIETAGKEVSSIELDLSGKIKSIVCAKADAIGVLYRKGNQTILSFRTSDEVSCGARPEHLKNQEIVASEIVDGKFITYWDKIFK